MPWMARIVLPGYAHHVVQRGHNRQAVFIDEDDHLRFLAALRDFRQAFRIRVLAWCLMTNYVHLLPVPTESNGLAHLMKRLAGRQTRYHNRLQVEASNLASDPVGLLFRPELISRSSKLGLDKVADQGRSFTCR